MVQTYVNDGLYWVDVKEDILRHFRFKTMNGNVEVRYVKYMR